MKNKLCILLLFVTQFAFTCDCKTKQNLNIKDWNDSEIVFTGTLTNIKKTNEFQKLKFSITKIYKGKLNNKSIIFTIKNNQNHNLLDHVENISKNQKWIIFSSIFKNEDTYTYELQNSKNHHICILSRPIVNNDPYLNFIEKIKNNPNNTTKNYYQNKRLFASGTTKNSVAIGKWKYYTNQGMDYYLEGNYVNGKQHGKWIKKALNFKNESVTLNEDTYVDGLLKERVVFNYIQEKTSHEVYGKNLNIKTSYKNNKVFQKWIVNKNKNTTLVQTFNNGIIIKSITKNYKMF